MKRVCVWCEDLIAKHPKHTKYRGINSTQSDCEFDGEIFVRYKFPPFSSHWSCNFTSGAGCTDKYAKKL